MVKEYLFVYGMFRDTAKSLLEETIFCGKAFVIGKIYKVNDFYPGFKRDSGKVWGDVYLINSTVLDKLDEFEGDEYTREKISTSTDVDCWIYVYKGDISKFKEVKGGDWLLR